MSGDLASVLQLSGYGSAETKSLEWALRLKNAKSVFRFLASLPPSQFVSETELATFRVLEQEGKVAGKNERENGEHEDENAMLKQRLQEMKMRSARAATQQKVLEEELARVKERIAKRKKMSLTMGKRAGDDKSHEISEQIAKVAQQSRELILLHKNPTAVLAANSLEELREEKQKEMQMFCSTSLFFFFFFFFLVMIMWSINVLWR